MRSFAVCLVVALLGLYLGAYTTTSADASSRVLPAGFHWRYLDHPVGDCVGHNRPGRRTLVIWRGNGDLQSALVCGDGTFWPS
jgi:hypothetical protein